MSAVRLVGGCFCVLNIVISIRAIAIVSFIERLSSGGRVLMGISTVH